MDWDLSAFECVLLLLTACAFLWSVRFQFHFSHTRVQPTCASKAILPRERQCLPSRESWLLVTRMKMGNADGEGRMDSTLFS
ncbi:MULTISPECIES: hypothetical protein [Thermoactinomyces]|uniref:Uncharacterized protein n=1 Tax=Thermoactinomyces daqus TaxID=1329516 RepID=A0A7W1XA69_9BACL|nr:MULTISPECIES: hypothetical protein [Thermoactinomyces]MBA4542829.1 hypothetical protein [Thermoactinomyces daqus]MBH8606882.1 hypothetical protein [Thermoactinomyces sp. CICC 10521]